MYDIIEQQKDPKGWNFGKKYMDFSTQFLSKCNAMDYSSQEELLKAMLKAYLPQIEETILARLTFGASCVIKLKRRKLRNARKSN